MTAELQIRQDGDGIPPLGVGFSLRRHPPPPLGAGCILRRMYKKKLQLCTLGYAERKIPSGENQNRYLMLFDDRHCFPALQAGAKPELCFYVRRRLEPNVIKLREKTKKAIENYSESIILEL
jgi:hypothetical protein